MVNYHILIINSEDLDFNTVKFFENVGGKCWLIEINTDPGYSLDLNFTRLTLPDNIAIKLYGKSPGQHINNFFPRFLNTMSAKSNEGPYIGCILMVSVEYKHFPERKTWNEDRSSYSEHFAVNRAKKQLNLIQSQDPERPIIIATYNHHLENSMTMEELSRELKLKNNEEIIKIYLNDSFSCLQPIYRLCDRNGLKY